MKKNKLLLSFSFGIFFGYIITRLYSDLGKEMGGRIWTLGDAVAATLFLGIFIMVGWYLNNIFKE